VPEEIFIAGKIVIDFNHPQLKFLKVF